MFWRAGPKSFLEWSSPETPVLRIVRILLLVLLALLILPSMLGPSLGVDLNYLSRWLSGITLWLLNGIVSLTGIEPTLNLFLGAA